jgi:antitoxin component of MazEF toxin-antitoxin module
MVQKLTKLSEKTKAIIIPNTILKKFDDPEAFELEIEQNRLVLKPLKKQKNENKKLNYDNSIDLYNID